MRELVTIRESYPVYKEKCREHKFTPIKAELYFKVISQLMRYMVDKILDGYEVRLGANLGVLAVRGTKSQPVINEKGEIKGIAPSWAKTKKLWQQEAEKQGKTFEEWLASTPKAERHLVYCFNEHSNGVRYKIVWYKSNVTVKNKSYYGLTSMRNTRRELWRRLISGEQYIVDLPKEPLKRKGHTNITLNQDQNGTL